MTTTASLLQWSESEPPAEVRTGERLDELLDQISATCQSDSPISVVLRVHGYEAHILLGLNESFVYLDAVIPAQYYITVGEFRATGVVGFYLFGQHHTEFKRRHLIPADTARRVLREFFETGRRSTGVEWEDGRY